MGFRYTQFYLLQGDFNIEFETWLKVWSLVVISANHISITSGGSWANFSPQQKYIHMSQKHQLGTISESEKQIS